VARDVQRSGVVMASTSHSRERSGSMPRRLPTFPASSNAAALSQVALLTVCEVAGMMRVSKMTVYRMVHSGELPALRAAGRSGYPSRPCMTTCATRSSRLANAGAAARLRRRDARSLRRLRREPAFVRHSTRSVATSFPQGRRCRSTCCGATVQAPRTCLPQRRELRRAVRCCGTRATTCCSAATSRYRRQDHREVGRGGRACLADRLPQRARVSAGRTTSWMPAAHDRAARDRHIPEIQHDPRLIEVHAYLRRDVISPSPRGPTTRAVGRSRIDAALRRHDPSDRKRTRATSRSGSRPSRGASWDSPVAPRPAAHRMLRDAERYSARISISTAAASS